MVPARLPGRFISGYHHKLGGETVRLTIVGGKSVMMETGGSAVMNTDSDSGRIPVAGRRYVNCMRFVTMTTDACTAIPTFVPFVKIVFHSTLVGPVSPSGFPESIQDRLEITRVVTVRAGVTQQGTDRRVHRLRVAPSPNLIPGMASLQAVLTLAQG